MKLFSRTVAEAPQSAPGGLDAHAVRALAACGDKVALSITDLADTLGRLSGATRATAAATGRISTGAHEVADEASAVASSAEQMSAAMGEVSQAASQATAAISEASEAVHSVRGAATQLAESAGQIDEVVRTVARISDQTRLLALNATIEAARAGSAGKGFAVVAEEVKSLADETNEATGDIEEKLGVLAANSEQVKDYILRIDETLTRVESLQQSIAAAVEQQNAAIAEITRAASAAAVTAQDLNSQVGACTQAMEDAEAASTVSASAMQEVRKSITVQRERLAAALGSTQVHPLRAALLAHAAWKERLRTAIDTGKLPEGVEIATAARDDACPFGKWLHSGAAVELDPVRARSVIAHHADFHRQAADILRAATTGQTAEAERMIGDRKGYAGTAPTLTADLIAWADEADAL